MIIIEVRGGVVVEVYANDKRIKEEIHLIDWDQEEVGEEAHWVRYAEKISKMPKDTKELFERK